MHKVKHYRNYIFIWDGNEFLSKSFPSFWMTNCGQYENASLLRPQLSGKFFGFYHYFIHLLFVFQKIKRHHMTMDTGTKTRMPELLFSCRPTHPHAVQKRMTFFLYFYSILLDKKSDIKVTILGYILVQFIPSLVRCCSQTSRR